MCREHIVAEAREAEDLAIKGLVVEVAPGAAHPPGVCWVESCGPKQWQALGALFWSLIGPPCSAFHTGYLFSMCHWESDRPLPTVSI